MKTNMKTKSIYLVAFLLMSAVATFGNDEPKNAGVAVIAVKGADVFKVVYKTEAANDVKIKLYNANSEVILSQVISNTDGFILPLNFTNLAAGEYKVELIDANGVRAEKIAYLQAKPVDNIRVARIANEQAKFLVSVMSAKNETVTVRIFDNYNNLLHTEVKNVSGDFAQVYTVKNLNGACTFEISDDAGRVKTVQF